jgi:hypothetical protein
VVFGAGWVNAAVGRRVLIIMVPAIIQRGDSLQPGRIGGFFFFLGEQ